MNLEEMLTELEGKKHAAYPDPLTGGAPWTIGIGHTGPEVHEGLVWDDFQIDAAFQIDVGEAYAACQSEFPWFSQLNEPRQAVLTGMAFQMGLHGLLGFHDTLGAIRDERYSHAAECMRQSKWASQTPKRAKRMADQMEFGEWQ